MRIQLSKGSGGSNPIAVAASIIKNEGMGGLYKGLSAGLLRQATYTTTRMGIFNSMLQNQEKDGQKASVSFKVFAGLFAGAVGTF